MPRGDRTGPRGAGPMTGRGAGYCAGYDVPGYANPFGGRFLGRGGGRGWRNMYYATGLPGWYRAGYAPAWQAPVGSAYPPAAPLDEVTILKQQAQALSDQLAAINQRLKELEDKD